MKKNQPLRNVEASVRDRLLNVMSDSGQDYNVLLTRYAIERLLYRLAASQYRSQFILKGAMLFAAWQHTPHRVTKDVDLLGFGDSTPETLKAIFAEICAEPVIEDGVLFDPSTVHAEPIRSQEMYAGVRVTMHGSLGNAKLHVQVDVGFGDSFAVEPVDLSFPSLIEMPAPAIRAYRMETAIAEKFEAVVTLGLMNTRMKDYFDLWYLAKNFAFDGQSVCDSIRITFERRGKALPEAAPVGLTESFWSDAHRMAMWESFCKKSVRTKPFPSLEAVGVFVSSFIVPPVIAASKRQSFSLQWKVSGPWA